MEQWSLKKVTMGLAGNGGHYRGEDGVSRQQWAFRGEDGVSRKRWAL